mmetsp:Transcript_35338/g.43205  ORF Transcript_35338/g.43205 Transcript_35338/m.43205 type:complete len:80 (+) Transcript_35338:87-326(+)
MDVRHVSNNSQTRFTRTPHTDDMISLEERPPGPKALKSPIVSELAIATKINVQNSMVSDGLGSMRSLHNFQNGSLAAGT